MIASEWISKGNALKKLGRYAEAMEYYDKALEIDPKHALAWHNKGDALYALGRYEEAVDCYDRALEIDPNLAPAWAGKVDALRKLGRYEEALKCLEKVREMDQKDAETWNNRGNVLRKLARYEEASAANSEMATKLIREGVALSMMGMHDEALNYFEKVLEIDPDYVAAWYNKGSVANKLGRYEEAIKCYDKALEIEPNYKLAIKSMKIVERKVEQVEKIAKEAISLLDSLRNMKKDVEKLGLPLPDFSEIEKAISEGRYDFAIKEARKLREEIESEIEKSKPALFIALETTTFRLRAGTRTKLLLKNTGSTSAEDIKLEVAGDDLLGKDALAWRVLFLPEAINPGESKPAELWLTFNIEGDLPLTFLLKYKDALGREYEHRQEIWVTVSSAFEAPTPQPTVQTLSNALEERYELLEFIDEGGFGEVWKAKRREDGAVVALKLPRALTEAGRGIFLQELGVWKLLSGSRHVVELYGCDILSWRGRQQPCIEMELGECSLRHRLPMSVERACRVMFDIAEALTFAHKRGILHRDIKPENIIFVNGIPKLTDFGLARLKTSRYSRTPGGGTVWYSAPEQFSPSKFGGVGEHTDVYQLGVVFYELLTGELPYSAEDEGKYMHAVLYEEPRPLRELKPEVPEQVEAIVMRCLEKQPERRYKNAGELREALAEYLGVEYSRRLSKSGKDVRSSVFYCGELLLLHLREARNNATDRQRALERFKEAYKFATDILQKYCPDKMKERNEKICRYIKWKLEEDPNLPKSLEVPEEFIADVEDFVHKLRLGFDRV